MTSFLALAIESFVIVLDGFLALAEIVSTVREVWCSPPPAVLPHPLVQVADGLMELTARELRSMAPRGLRRARKAEIVTALVALPL